SDRSRHAAHARVARRGNREASLAGASGGAAHGLAGDDRGVGAGEPGRLRALQADPGAGTEAAPRPDSAAPGVALRRAAVRVDSDFLALAVRRANFRLDPAAHVEISGDLDPPGTSGLDQIVQDAVRHVLVEGALVAIGPHVELQRLQL